MIDESNIPLLEDLVSRGQLEHEDEQPHLSADDNSDMQIEQETHDNETINGQDQPIAHKIDELEEDASLKELIIDEEIRMILDRHMDKAYEEIIRLLSHKIS